MSYKNKVTVQRETAKVATLKDRIRRLEASAAGLMALAGPPSATLPVEWGVAGWVCKECQQPLLDRRELVDKGMYGALKGTPVGVVPHTKSTCLGIAHLARTGH